MHALVSLRCLHNGRLGIAKHHTTENVSNILFGWHNLKLKTSTHTFWTTAFALVKYDSLVHSSSIEAHSVVAMLFLYFQGYIKYFLTWVQMFLTCLKACYVHIPHGMDYRSTKCAYWVMSVFSNVFSSSLNLIYFIKSKHSIVYMFSLYVSV